MANQQIVKCELTGSVIYEQDAIHTKSGYVSLIGEHIFLSNRYEYLKSLKGRNFALYLLPYLLAILFFGVFLILLSFDVKNSEYYFIAAGLAIAIMFVVSAGLFVSNHSVLDDIGDPERTVIECTGRIDLYSGRIEATARAYDEYSGVQVVQILINIVKFLLVFVGLVALGWLYWIIYMARMGRVKRIDNKLLTFMNYPPATMTSIIICATDPKGFEEFDAITYENDEEVCIQQKYNNTFWINGTIYGLFGNPQDKTNCEIVEVLPGYKNRKIVDEEQKANLINAYLNL